MAYLAQTDLLVRITPQELQQLTDDTRSGQVNETTVSAAIEEATGIIDGYCRARYQVPLQASNEVLRIGRDITVYLLYSRRPQKMSETVRQRYEDAMALLKGISKGDVQLDQPDNSVVPQTPAGCAVVSRQSERDQRFSDRNLEGYVG